MLDTAKKRGATVTVWIPAELLDTWDGLENKSQWVKEYLEQERTN